MFRSDLQFSERNASQIEGTIPLVLRPSLFKIPHLGNGMRRPQLSDYYGEIYKVRVLIQENTVRIPHATRRVVRAPHVPSCTRLRTKSGFLTVGHIVTTGDVIRSYVPSRF